MELHPCANGGYKTTSPLLCGLHVGTRLTQSSQHPPTRKHKHTHTCAPEKHVKGCSSQQQWLTAWKQRISEHYCTYCRNFCNWDQEFWSAQTILDNSIVPFQSSWSLNSLVPSAVSEKIWWFVDLEHMYRVNCQITKMTTINQTGNYKWFCTCAVNV